MVQKINPHPAPGCIRSPPTMYFQRMQFLGVFCPLLQRSLHNKYKQTPKKHNNNNLNLKLSSVTYIIDERYQIIDLGSQFLGYMLDQTVKLG